MDFAFEKYLESREMREEISGEIREKRWQNHKRDERIKDRRIWLKIGKNRREK